MPAASVGGLLLLVTAALTAKIRIRSKFRRSPEIKQAFHPIMKDVMGPSSNGKTLGLHPGNKGSTPFGIH